MKYKILGILFIAFLMAGGWFWADSATFRSKMPPCIQSYLGYPPTAGTLELQGNVEVREVRLGFKVFGRIATLEADEGDMIHPGQLIATLEPEYFEDSRRQAEAALQARKAELLKLTNGSRPEEIEQARAHARAAEVAFVNVRQEFVRAQNLVGSGSVSRETFDNAQSARDQTKAAWEAAKATLQLVQTGPRKEDISRARALVNQGQALVDEAARRLQDTRLRAPSGGTVQTRVHEPGDYVGIGETVYTVTITDPVWVRTYVNEMDLGRIRPGMPAEVRTDAGISCKGQVGFISPTAEFTPKTVETKEIRTDLVYRVRIIVQDPKKQLRQGMPASVHIIE